VVRFHLSPRWFQSTGTKFVGIAEGTKIVDFLNEMMGDTDSIPPSAEVQAWAEKHSDSNGERRTGWRWELLWVTLVVLVSVVAIGFGAFLATVGMMKAGYCG
jgi:hypothetical protein